MLWVAFNFAVCYYLFVSQYTHTHTHDIHIHIHIRKRFFFSWIHFIFPCGCFFYFWKSSAWFFELPGCFLLSTVRGLFFVFWRSSCVFLLLDTSTTTVLKLHTAAVCGRNRRWGRRRVSLVHLDAFDTSLLLLRLPTVDVSHITCINARCMLQKCIEIMHFRQGRALKCTDTGKNMDITTRWSNNYRFFKWERHIFSGNKQNTTKKKTR